MRSSGGSDAALLQISSLRSCVAPPARTSSRSAALISASRGPLQSLSRERDFSRVTGGTNGSEGLPIQLELQRSGVVCGDVKLVACLKDVILAGFHGFIEHLIAVGSDRQFCLFDGLNLQFQEGGDRG
jgi:hypothetical protein